MAEKIIVIVGKDGTTTVEGEGFSGPACDLKLRALAESLGVVEDVEKKSEWYGAESEANRHSA